MGRPRGDLDVVDAVVPQVYSPTPDQVKEGKKASIISAFRGWRIVVEDVQGEYQFTREEYLSDLTFRSFLKNIIAAAPLPVRGKSWKLQFRTWINEKERQTRALDSILETTRYILADYLAKG